MLDRLLRVENLVVIPLLVIAVLIAIGARWRDDPRRGQAATARVINMAMRIGLITIVVAIAFFVLLIIVVGPIGP